MKKLVVFVSFLLVVLLVGVSPCPYNDLAMCCTLWSGNVCKRWQNCCYCCNTVLSSEPQPNPESGAATPVLVANPTCVRTCNECTGSYPARDACYTSCASPPPKEDSTSDSCVALLDFDSDYDPHAMCCTEVSPGCSGVLYRRTCRGEPRCTRWENCRAVENDSKSTVYWPFADGVCANKCRTDLATHACSPEPTRLKEKLYDCFSRCAFPPPGIGYVQAHCLEYPSLYGASTAYVPMKHGSCDNVIDCSTHVIATTQGNLMMKLTVGMCCKQASGELETLTFQPDGGSVQNVMVGSNTLEPFTVEDLEEGCEEALGGSWPSNSAPKNSEQTVMTLIQKKVTVRAKCGEWQNTISRDYFVSLATTCFDTNWFVPPG